MSPSPSPSALTEAITFLRAFARRRAGRVIDVPSGFVVLDGKYPMSYDHNKLVVTGTPPPAEILTMADEALGGAGLGHRMVVVENDRHGRECAPALIQSGYLHETHLVMFYEGTTAHPAASTAITVDRVGLTDLAEFSWREWQVRLPHADAETVRQLVERRATLSRAADQVHFLAVRGEAGKIRSHADLYMDLGACIAQIEDLGTDPEHGGRGFAGAILADALRRARDVGCGRVFLVADADDWPKRWYRRLGYRTVGATHLFTRPLPGP